MKLVQSQDTKLNITYNSNTVYKSDGWKLSRVVRILANFKLNSFIHVSHNATHHISKTGSRKESKKDEFLLNQIECVDLLKEIIFLYTVCKSDK